MTAGRSFNSKKKRMIKTFPKARILLRVCVGAIFTFLTTGTIVGYQGLLPTLRAEGVLSNLCSSHLSEQNSTAPPTCEAQTLKLDLMFTLSISFLNFGCFPSGWLVANWGARNTCLLGCLLVAGGWGLFAASDNIAFPMFIMGYALAGLGSGPIVFSMLSLSGLSSKHSGTIVTMIVAGINLSSLVLVVFANIYSIWGIPLRFIILGYLAAPVTLMGLSFWLFPPTPCCQRVPQQQQQQNSVDHGMDSTPLMAADALAAHSGTDDPMKPSQGDQTTHDQEAAEAERVWFAHSSLAGAVRHPQFWIQFILVLVWSSANMTSSYYYIQNMDRQLLWLTNSTTDSQTGEKVFSYILPASTVFSLILGPVQDILRNQWRMWLLVLMTAVLPGAVAVTSNLPVYALQYVTMIMVSLFNLIFWAVAPELLNNMYGQRLGLTVYGVILALAAVANLSNYAWILVAQTVGWLPLNVGMYGFSCLAGLILTVFVWRWEQRFKSKIINGLQQSQK